MLLPCWRTKGASRSRWAEVRFLADENVPFRLIQKLADRGHEVIRVQDLAVAAADRVVLEHAVRLSAVLITLDSDFGTLVFAQGNKPPPGIVLLRLGAVQLVDVLAEVVDVIEVEMATSGRFLVVGREGVRLRSLGRQGRRRPG